MTICSSGNVYRMYSRLENQWFLIIAERSSIALKKSKIHLSIKYRIPLFSDNTMADIKQVIYSTDLDTGNLNRSVVKALNKEPLPMLSPFLAG